MDNTPNKIKDLQVERERLKARIEHIDHVLSAYQLLVSESVLLSDNVKVEIKKTVQTKPSIRTISRVAERDAAVHTAIERYKKRRFTAPDIARSTGLDKRRTKRAIDALVENGQVEIAQKGYKRRGTKYKVVELRPIK